MSIRVLWIVALSFDCIAAAAAQENTSESRLLEVMSEPGRISFGRHQFIEYQTGSAPLIISVPHGGYDRPESIPDRTMGTQGHHDVQTIELAGDISERFFELTGRVPYIIVNQLHRSKMDANREQYDATQDDSLATIAWEDFHSFVDSAKNDVHRKFNVGLYVDLHGHRHSEQRTELGYLLVASDLRQPDDSLRVSAFIEKSSIHALAARSRISFDRLVRGPESLGGFLEQMGYPAIPSPTNPNSNNVPYFSGGYSLEMHSSRDGGTVDGIQIETPLSVRSSTDDRITYGRALAKALVSFLQLHYAFDGTHPK